MESRYARLAAAHSITPSAVTTLAPLSTDPRLLRSSSQMGGCVPPLRFSSDCVDSVAHPTDVLTGFQQNAHMNFYPSNLAWFAHMHCHSKNSNKNYHDHSQTKLIHRSNYLLLTHSAIISDYSTYLFLCFWFSRRLCCYTDVQSAVTALILLRSIPTFVIHLIQRLPPSAHLS